MKADLGTPRRALAIGAHPDDVEFGCGATLAKWAAAGCAVHHLVLTDGSRGTWDANQDRAALVALRRDEQRDAARLLGGVPGGVVFLDWVDGELESGIAQRRQVCEVIRRVRPDVVLGHDPWRRYRLHPDHRHAGWLTVDGVVAAREPTMFDDLGLPAHRATALLLWEADEPDHLEDAGPGAGAKVAALLAHRSQHRSTMGIGADADQSEVERFVQRVHERLAEHGALGGLDAAEAFRLVDHI